MLWVLGYWIVGLVCMSIMLQPVLRQIAEECKDDPTRTGLRVWLSLSSFVFLPTMASILNSEGG